MTQRRPRAALFCYLLFEQKEQKFAIFNEV